MPPKQPLAPPLTKQPSATKKPAQTPQNTPSKPASKPQSSTPPQPPTTSSEQPKPRRKPRKLTRPSPQNASTTTNTTSPDPLTLTTEITALKSRMVSLESQVSTLYTATASLTSSPAGGPGKLPRRRGRGRGNGVLIPGAEEKVRELEDEIEGVGRDVRVLEARQHEQLLHEKGKGKRKTDGLGIKAAVLKEEDDDAVEEITRLDEPRIDTTSQAGKDRAVTLTGSYRIPLPATVSMDDVRTIQRGVSSANRIARGVLDGARGQGEGLGREGSRSRNGSESWSEWIGGYSMSVARFVKGIEADAAVEHEQQEQNQQQEKKLRPGAARRRTTPISASTSASTSPGQNAPKRPPARPRGSSSRLSQQEVETLMA